MRRLISMLLAATALVSAGGGCKKSRPDTSTLTRHRPGPSSAPSAAPPTPASQRVVGLAEARVHELVESWLAAQNSGDFGAYSALYARKFSGIQRVGVATKWFSRKTWLDDRKAMFRPGLRVQADDVAITTKPAAARVTFQQTFSVGSFRDVGRKEFIIVADGPALVIAREEMLTSAVAGAQRTAGSVFGVIDARVYLPGDPPDVALSSPPRLTAPPSPNPAAFASERTLDSARVPAPLRAWIGRSLHAVLADGASCDTRVSALAERAQQQPHFGVVQQWNGMDGPKASDTQVAEQLWAMASPLLVGDLDPGCPGALWATEGALPERTIARHPEGAVEDVLTRAFRRLPDYDIQQQRFVEDMPGAHGRWDDADAKKQMAVFPRGASSALAVVSSAAGPRGPGGCGEFFGALSVLFELDTSGSTPRVVRHAELESDDAVTPIMLFDADGDGSPELLTGPDSFDEQVVLWPTSGATLQGTVLSSVPYGDCPC